MMPGPPRRQESVTVITLTRRRPLLVQRAIKSVQAQETVHSVHHLILVDDCPETRTLLDSVTGRHPNIEVLYMAREPHEVSGPGRSSRLRNFGVRRSADRWIAQLDDDNEWTADHLDLLIECAVGHAVRAVYSQLSLLNQDGTPYLAPLWPWARSQAEARDIYQDYVAKGICTPGSNIVRDRPGVLDEPVDTNAWLLSRELLLEVPFEERFTDSDARNLVGEDDKLFWTLVERREPIVCTRKATLRYYLGGYSNNPAGKTDESFSWATDGAN
jgi:glycosyltransferase involved in cell wall biosynthesis